MIREIRKKMVILGNRSPFPQHTKNYIDHLERVDWIYMNLRLDGSPLTRENVESILNGEMILTGRIMDHVLIERLDRLRRELYFLAERGAKMDINLLTRLAWTFADGDAEAAGFRRSTPTLQEYSYTPVLPPYIMPEVVKLLDFADSQGEFDNPFVKAAVLHNRFMAVWPYRENNEIIARALMEYYLVRQGFPMVPLTMTESEYRTDFVNYTRAAGASCLADHLTKAVCDRLELMIQLTAY